MISDKLIFCDVNGFTLIHSSLKDNPKVKEIKLFHDNKIAYHSCVTQEKTFFENVPNDKHEMLLEIARDISKSKM